MNEPKPYVLARTGRVLHRPGCEHLWDPTTYTDRPGQRPVSRAAAARLLASGRVRCCMFTSPPTPLQALG